MIIMKNRRVDISSGIRRQYSIKRISCGLQSLLKCGEIGEVEVAAAERWHKDYTLGIVGARDPEIIDSGRAPDIHASMISRVNAVTRCRIVQTSLGRCSEYRLRLFLIDELPFSTIATILKMTDINGRKKVAAQMTLLLKQLTELYSNIDNRVFSK